MTVINTNVAALNAQAALSKTVDKMNTAMERLSTGLRINSASDDAAGVAIASRLNAEIKGINQAVRNAMDGQSMIDAAEGAHVEVENMLQRMRELSVQAANDTNGDTDRANLQLEVDQLMEEIDRIAEVTSWAGKSLLNGTSSGVASSHDDVATFNFQIGSGLSDADNLSVEIGATSSAALGLAAAENSTSTSATADDPATISISGNTVTLDGTLEHGDVFQFDLNDNAVTVTYSTIDEYSDDLNGLASQIKDKVDSLVTAGTIGNDITTVNNGDGTLTISQSSTPDVDTVAVSDTTAASDASVAFSGNTITYTVGTSGQSAADDGITFNVNGIAVSALITTTTDGFTDNAAGMGALMKNAIENTAGLENVNVVDNGDGSISLSQNTTPVLEAEAVTLYRSREASLSLSASSSNTATLSVGGSFVDGKEYSFELFGEEISVTASTDDSFDDSKAGIASQIAQAINDKGISGISAIRTANANTVTITAKVEAGDATTASGGEFVATTIGSTSAAAISLSGTDVVQASATTATYSAGDSYSFSVAGESFTLSVGSDGYGNTIAGVSQQMKDLIDEAGIGGLVVTALTSTATSAGVTLAMSMTGVTGGTGGSTAVTDILVKDSTSSSSSSTVADLSVTSTANASDAISRIDAAIETLNTQRADLGAISNRLDHATSNLTNISANLAAGKSRIEDADFAQETSSLTKTQILNQAATAMLAQANASKQNVLSLLQG